MSQAIGKFTRTIKLPPAIGDWTSIDPTVQSESGTKIRSVKPANFDNLDRDAMKLAHRIQHTVGEHVCKKLSQDMDIKIELHTVKATQMTYGEFVKQLQSSPVIQADLVLDTGDRINILLDWPLAEQIVNRLTGGKGEAAGAAEFSSIEAGILEAQLDEISQLIPGIWKNPSLNQSTTKFEFSAGTYEINRKVSPRDAYIIFEYELILGFGGIHRLTWAYPNPLIRQLLTQYQSATQAVIPTLAIDDATLIRSYLPAKVILGESKIPMGVLANLEEGDIIKLASSIEEPLKLIIADTTVLHIQPGVQNNRLAAQVIFWDGPIPAASHPVSIKTNTSLPSAAPTINDNTVQAAGNHLSTATSLGGAALLASAATMGDPRTEISAPDLSSNSVNQPVDEINPYDDTNDDWEYETTPETPPHREEASVDYPTFDFDDGLFSDPETQPATTTYTEAPSFDSEDLFGDHYDLTADADTQEETALFGDDDDDDDFSWEDLENEA